MTASAATAGRALPLRRKLVFGLAALLLFWLGVEVIARVGAGIGFASWLEREVDLMKSAYPVEYDRELGWVPRRGFHGRQNVWHTQVTIDEQGLRSNGEDDGAAAARPVLAVGDSYTFGDEVSDADSWPAQLEHLLHRKVVNGGVFGYGIDQAVLRAERLVDQVHPEWVVLSFIPDDVQRCELDVSGAAKPFFRVVDGTLHLENQPVPEPEPVPMDLFRRVAGYSWAVHTVMRKLLPHYWFEGRDRREIVHHDGIAVAKELLRRLARELGEHGIRLAVVVEADSRLLEDDQREGAEVLASLAGTEVRCLDLHPELVALRARDRAAFQAMYRGHMTPAGNHWVAEHIAALLQR